LLRPAALTTRRGSDDKTGTYSTKARRRQQAPKLNHRQEAHLVALFDRGDHSTTELAELFGVTRSTVFRAVEGERARARVDGGGIAVDN
jgi:DNA-binding MarR family transcriptional regulator